MDLVTSGALSIAAISISACSAVVAVLSLRQSARQYPKPVMNGWLSLRYNTDAAQLNFKLQNLGNAPARDVQYSMVCGGKTHMMADEAEFAERDSMANRWLVREGELYSLSPTASESLLNRGPYDPKEVRVRVRWREAPKLDRWRTATFKPRVTTSWD